MKPNIKADITVGTLASMTTPQFEALRDNVLAEGLWETVEEITINGSGDYVGVWVGGMFLGIEKDGYTHS